MFVDGGPTFAGGIFPFVFICIMCGAISGFHALVSSGTTPKMIDKESQIRPIGYGAMLIEGLVGVVALIAAASLPSDLYYDINVAIDAAPKFQEQLNDVQAKYGVQPPAEAKDPLHAANVDSPQHLDLGQVEEKVGGESLRGRTGGAVTLAVGMSLIFERRLPLDRHHRRLAAEVLVSLRDHVRGAVHPHDDRHRHAHRAVPAAGDRRAASTSRSRSTDWLPGALLRQRLVTAGWGWLISTGSIDTIWPMFGIANQLLAVLALALVTTWLVNGGRGRYAPVTILPMLFVTSTTLTAASTMVTIRFPAMIRDGKTLAGYLNISLTIFVVVCVCTLVLWSIARWIGVWFGRLVVGPERTP